MDAIIAVRAHFHRASMAFVGKQLLRHHAAEFAIIADIAEAVQIQPFGCLTGAVPMRLQTLGGRRPSPLASLVKGEPNSVLG